MTLKLIENRQILVATQLMIVAALLAAIDIIIVRLLTEDLHPFLIAFFRSLFGLLFISPWILKKRSVLKTHYSYRHVFRAGFKLLSLVAFFIAITTAPLVDVTTIAFTAPIFVMVGAWFFLGEKPVIGRIFAVMCGFGGVLFVLQPGQGIVSTALLFALAGAILAAVIQLMLKGMSRQDSTNTLVAWNLIATVPLAAIPLFWFWTTPTWEQLGLLMLQGVLGALNMATVTRAFALAEASFVSPLEFLRLPAIALFAFLFFDEVASLTTLIGAGIIFLSILFMGKNNRS